MIQGFDVGTRMSEIAVHNGTVYLAGQIADRRTHATARTVQAQLAKPGWKIEMVVTAAV